MMRGPKTTAMAVRNTKGEVVVEEFPTKGVQRPAICRWPIIRGVFGFIDSMTLGYKCLMRSAELSGLEDIVEESPKKKEKRQETVESEAECDDASAIVSDEPIEKPTETGEKEKKLPAWVMTATMVVSLVIGIALAVGLFVFLPTFLYNLLSDHVGFLKHESVALNSLLKSVFEGILRIALLVGYMAAVSLMKDIRRTFMYHGAEHKTIFCYEAGDELTVENIRRQRRFHPRCGTSFLIVIVLVSIFISFFIDPIAVLFTGKTLPTLLRVAVKILLLPFTMGIGYELIKFAGRHDNWFTHFISLPGIWLQHITVFEPTDDMIECAIASVKRVIPNDDSDRW